MLQAMNVAPLLTLDLLGARPHPATGAGSLVLLAFVASFLAIRTSARLARSVAWWPGSVRSGDVHIHHLVWGICLMMLSGFLAFAASPAAPWWHLIAILFGIGAGFTLDEFALWVHLEDVYWLKEGRRSFDAVLAAGAFAGLVVLGTTPFGLDGPAPDGATAAAVTLVLGLAIVSFLKGRVMLGVLALFVPVAGLVGALRIAQPASPWARRRYSPERLRLAQARFAPDRPLARCRERLGDLLLGAPRDDAPCAPGAAGVAEPAARASGGRPTGTPRSAASRRTRRRRRGRPRRASRGRRR